eukprot:CAMPEP_0181099234 /NCGR_PEP_ID=MMETSP1071-20121207/12552_1 /TAXON_ID=35127 /ORGANISM="Thalassiosira sp., Strain NH16" /LENGTH=258 /DNA_ID=CAMNT_0023181885 /DNA_START=104 /DNA_END=880 /DNA_ORIENTATION=-
MAGLGRRSHYRKHLTDAVLNDLPEPDESIGQRVARVVGTRGGNMFDVIVAPQAGDEDGMAEPSGAVEHGSSGKEEQSTETSEQRPPIQKIQRAPQLAFLPTKFRKLVWIKRNDFVIVECGEDEDEEETRRQKQKADNPSQKDLSAGGGFRHVITHILYKDQVKHIKSKGLWPSDPYFADDDTDEVEGSHHDGGKAENEESHPDNPNKEVEPLHQDGAYEDNGIVFDDPYGDDELMVNTNRIATLRVEDSSSEDDSDDE